jgi:Tol biopolymer transport system component
MYAFDPRTARAEPIHMVFPEQALWGPDWYPGLRVEIASFAHDIPFVVYFAYGPITGDTYYALWNLNTASSVWRSPPSWGSLPLWRPDSAQFAYSSMAVEPSAMSSPPINYEIYLVSSEGKASALTEFSSWLAPDEVLIPQISWSPDGNDIAYFVGTRASPAGEFAYRLATTSLDDLETTVYCPTFDLFQTPKWSPDSRFLALHLGSVVDTHANSIFQVTDYGIPLSWINSGQ